MASEIMEKINDCLISKTNFLLSGGAGCGKTHTLMQTLHRIFEIDPKSRVACITYTNVAANEIKERSPYARLQVSTIHDFLWDTIGGYQKNLKETVLALIEAEQNNSGKGLKYSGENIIDQDSFECVQYRSYRNLEKGIISHDDLLKISEYMFASYKMLGKILAGRYDYILIDEYQDTQQQVVSIFLEHIKPISDGTLCIGFFGDSMQSIYDSGVGNIQNSIDAGDVLEIKKEDNYRCSISVINLLNNFRTDIQQNPSKLDSNSTIANKPGSATFVYSSNDFDLDLLQSKAIVSGWDFDNPFDTKVLFLTHRLSAAILGFEDLLKAYKYNDNLVGSEPDLLALLLLRIGGILYHYQEKNYALVLKLIQREIESVQDKQVISNFLLQQAQRPNCPIEDAIEAFSSMGFIRLDNRFDDYIEAQEDAYTTIKELPLSQAIAYYIYQMDYSPYSTQHGVKGAEFENVLVVLDNGKWNNYNFKYFFEDTPEKELILQRTERILYVCCSRAKDNLVVYYPNPTKAAIEKAKTLFGSQNVVSID